MNVCVQELAGTQTKYRGVVVCERQLFLGSCFGESLVDFVVNCLKMRVKMVLGFLFMVYFDKYSKFVRENVKMI